MSGISLLDSRAVFARTEWRGSSGSPASNAVNAKTVSAFTYHSVGTFAVQPSAPSSDSGFATMQGRPCLRTPSMSGAIKDVGRLSAERIPLRPSWSRREWAQLPPVLVLLLDCMCRRTSMSAMRSTPTLDLQARISMPLERYSHRTRITSSSNDAFLLPCFCARASIFPTWPGALSKKIRNWLRRRFPISTSGHYTFVASAADAFLSMSFPCRRTTQPFLREAFPTPVIFQLLQQKFAIQTFVLLGYDVFVLSKTFDCVAQSWNFTARIGFSLHFLLPATNDK